MKVSFLVPEVTKPDHFVYYMTCKAKQQVLKSGDPWRRPVSMSIDIWCLLNKHKTMHNFCQQYCNLAAFPELKLDDGTGWWFNTSIAEQTNVWLGSFHSMVWEMLLIRCNFFLDEMVHLCNINTMATLKSWKHEPNVYSFQPQQHIETFVVHLQ
ncbi:hypothetical protein CONPUDRAFT_53432 [Coniophora puteana RWD-64-598 SS2]|uniref:Uncharacterized protein n=1 Tax=Coniophora puteana (strain RWD-64-598) TaxID=741705 RepID=A0A5M3MV98_CONPW|nr:uncharacterized protein CONPUDRAFT_53432 [Coniophora puteana RWD-64-598 SS2]EIW82970.1 hypothetical protein CONPUDRAFT_53432 [Coniophora puteana RWD-64-598 SS2]